MKKYVAIANDIREKILDETYKVGDMLPYEYELCKLYDCSKQTMKKALEILVREELIYRQQGAGTFVKNKEVIKETFDFVYENKIKGFTKNFSTLGKISANILQFSVIRPSNYIATNLQIPETSFVYQIERVRLIDDVPHVVEMIYMPINLIVGLSEENLHNSIYNYIEDNLKLKIRDSQKIIKAFPSTEHDQEILLLDENEPVVEVEKVSYLTTGEPFELSYSRFNYKYFTFRAISSH